MLIGLEVFSFKIYFFQLSRLPVLNMYLILAGCLLNYTSLSNVFCFLNLLYTALDIFSASQLEFYQRTGVYFLM